ncbi:MAG: hypothetical protein Kow0060_08170 [Methylohalobius crimeensis]
MEIRRKWQLQTAKARLSSLIKNADSEGPQEITIRGKAAAVILSREDYEKLTAKKPAFLQFMRQSPLGDTALEIERDSSPARKP